MPSPRLLSLMTDEKSATATVQVDERGRLVLPKGVRVYLDIEPRDTVQVEVTKP